MKSKIAKQVKKTVAKPKRISRPRSKGKEQRKEYLWGLEKLKSPYGGHTKKKLLGRGSSSGHGKTSTRGSKGQTSRSGRHFYRGFEGAQIPFIKKIPKRGFSNFKFRKKYQIVNIKDLIGLAGNRIDPQLLEARGLIVKKESLVKILGEGELNIPIAVSAHAFSKSAKEKIEKAGGQIEVINV